MVVNKKKLDINSNDKDILVDINSSEVRFPEAAILFKFCQSVIEYRTNERVNDQKLGSIIKATASDTSHWKHGRKSIKSIYAFEALAQELKVNYELISDIADGSLDFEEAWLDFLDVENQTNFLNKYGTINLHKRYSRATQIAEVAESLLERSSIDTLPVHIPELIEIFPFIQLVTADIEDKLARTLKMKTDKYKILYRKTEMRAHLRIAIVRELAKILLISERKNYNLNFPDFEEEYLFFDIIDLANSLLIPEKIIKKEFLNLDIKNDLILNISNLFWVPKLSARNRLLIIINNNNHEYTAKNFHIKPNIFAHKNIITQDFSEED